MNVKAEKVQTLSILVRWKMRKHGKTHLAGVRITFQRNMRGKEELILNEKKKAGRVKPAGDGNERKTITKKEG